MLSFIDYYRWLKENWKTISRTTRIRLLCSLCVIVLVVWYSWPISNYYSCKPSKIKIEFNSTYGATCSEKAYKAGNHQKVFVYSLYDPLPRYWGGIEDIIVTIRRIFPGWFVRVYTDRWECDFFDELEAKYDNFHLCKVLDLPPPTTSLEGFPSMMWRYFPLGDDQIDVINFRDSDSQILQRDKDAVDEWLKSTNYSVHMMRDNPSHLMPIMGGMWGARLTSKNRNKFKTLKELLLRKTLGSKVKKHLDQALLLEVIYPNIRGDYLAHDSYSCRIFNNTVPFPTRRGAEGFYTHVGAYFYNHRDSHEWKEECPVECRPKSHQDWIYC